MTTDNKQSVLTDAEIMALWAERADINHFARTVEQAVLSKLRGAGEPSDAELLAFLKEIDGEINVKLTENDPGYLDKIKLCRALLSRYTAPQASAEGDIQAKLKDPNVVHVNMLRGTIAPITFDQLAHVLGDEATAKWIADRQQRGGDVLALHVINSARAALDASTEANDDDMSLLVPSHLHAALSLAVDEYDAAIAQQGKGE